MKFVVSLDAATGEMYRFMRPSSDFERVSHNIKYDTDRLRALRRDRSWVRINMSICETNLEEVPGFVDLANELGVQKVTFNHLNEGLTHIIEGVDGREWDYVKESRFSDPARHDALLLQAWSRANETGMSMEFSGTPFIGPDAASLTDIAQLMTSVPFLVGGDVPWASAHHTRLDPSLPPCFKPWRNRDPADR